MDGRADNFLYALEGSALDWGRLLGSGFTAAPEGWVSVYRECSLEEIVRIAREGLSAPPPETRPPDFREEIELLDSCRTPKMVKAGISRTRAITAAPSLESARARGGRGRIALEVKVDPTECFVGDADFIVAMMPTIGVQRYGMEKYRGSFRRYWESIISLADFLKWYRRVETFAGSQWFPRHAAPPKQPGMYFAPEVLVMTPVVSRAHVRIVRGDVTDIVDECEHDHEDEEEFQDGL